MTVSRRLGDLENVLKVVLLLPANVASLRNYEVPGVYGGNREAIERETDPMKSVPRHDLANPNQAASGFGFRSPIKLQAGPQIHRLYGLGPKSPECRGRQGHGLPMQTSGAAWNLLLGHPSLCHTSITRSGQITMRCTQTCVFGLSRPRTSAGPSDQVAEEVKVHLNTGSQAARNRLRVKSTSTTANDSSRNTQASASTYRSPSQTGHRIFSMKNSPVRPAAPSSSEIKLVRVRFNQHGTLGKLQKSNHGVPQVLPHRQGGASELQSQSVVQGKADGPKMIFPPSPFSWGVMQNVPPSSYRRGE